MIVKLFTRMSYVEGTESTVVLPSVMSNKTALLEVHALMERMIRLEFICKKMGDLIL